MKLNDRERNYRHGNLIYPKCRLANMSGGILLREQHHYRIKLKDQPERLSVQSL